MAFDRLSAFGHRSGEDHLERITLTEGVLFRKRRYDEDTKWFASGTSSEGEFDSF
jgi:hypothetical protein